MRVRNLFPVLSSVDLLAIATAGAHADGGGDKDNAGKANGQGVAAKDVTKATPAKPAVPATPAIPADPGVAPATPATPAKPATPATPATPGTPAEPPAAAEDAPKSPAAPEPQLGKKLGVDPEGPVRVRLPGGEWKAIEAGAAVPNGTVVDARAGAVTLTAAVDAAGTQQSAAFKGGQFTVRQPTADHPITELKLTGGNFAACRRASTRATAHAAKSKKPVRSLFGSGHGRFRTQGKHAAATVRGTIWITEDYCDRTVIRVKRGVVGVKDLRTGKVVAVRAGSSRTIRRR